MDYKKLSELSICPALKDYLFGRLETGVLLLGQKGMDLVRDAVTAASLILGTDNPSLSPDYMFVGLMDDEKSLGVEKAESIVERSSLRPSTAERTVVIIDQMDRMTVPAQNKLLKVLEDSGTTLVIGVAYDDTIIPTVKSRMQVVTYAPMDLDSFIGYCDRNGIPEPKVQYFLSGGMVGNILEDPVIDVFKNVGADIENRRFSNLLRSLNLIKEKDKDSFFLSNREYVSSLISYMGQVITESNGDYGLITLCGEHRERCTSSNYTKDDFFSLITQIIWKGEKHESL